MSPERLVVAGDWAVLWGYVGSQIEHQLIDIAPAPALRRIIAFDDGMFGVVEMLGGVFVLGLIAAADMPASAADAQMQPFVAHLETFLASQRAGRDFPDRIQMRAPRCHHIFLSATPLLRVSARKACSAATTWAPSPTEAATRLTDPARTSPIAKTPSRLVASA